MTYSEIIHLQRKYYAEGHTLSYAFRRQQLEKFLELVIAHEEAILDALQKDLHKSSFEGWGVEVGVIITETKYFIRHLKHWMKPKRVKTPLLHFRSRSYIKPVPHGNTLIIAPWNYPFLLAMRPLIGAIAAGNTAIIKPSEHAIHTAKLMEAMINDHFDPAFIRVLLLDASGSAALSAEKFDFIYYTGGANIGRSIYTSAAKNLTPVVLELGGKNPCIIDETADIDITASRITWGKFSNCGQTCVAPDYLLVHASVKDRLATAIIKNIESFFQNELINTEDYGRIINDFHVERISRLISNMKIIYGGDVLPDQRYISPTLIEIDDLQSPIMQEEIFGPVLPVLTYNDFSEIKQIIAHNPDPLVLYIFSKNKQHIGICANEIGSGDMVVNEVILHFGHLHLPIGGKGSSGFGKTQGKYTFNAFSHQKSLMHRSYFPDLTVRYPPYNSRKSGFIRWVFKYFFS